MDNGNQHIKLWGVRGSLPTPQSPAAIEVSQRKLFHLFFDQGYSSKNEIDPFFSSLPVSLTGGYGGNTMCAQVINDENSLFIDCGSGLRNAGFELLSGPCGKGKGAVHILMTHFHWDHLIGLPFFIPLFIPGNTIHFYAVQENLEKAIRQVLKKPWFPVDFDDRTKRGAEVVFHRLEPRKQILINDFSVTPYHLDHPDPCWGYRIEKNNRSYVHAVDTECKRNNRELLKEDTGLYENGDLMLFDAQYSLLESATKMDWGHSTSNLGLDLGRAFNIKKIVFTHHDPMASAQEIEMGEINIEAYQDIQLAARHGSKNKIETLFAREGMSIPF